MTMQKRSTRERLENNKDNGDDNNTEERDRQ